MEIKTLSPSGMSGVFSSEMLGKAYVSLGIYLSVSMEMGIKVAVYGNGQSNGIYTPPDSGQMHDRHCVPRMEFYTALKSERLQYTVVQDSSHTESEAGTWMDGLR